MEETDRFTSSIFIAIDRADTLASSIKEFETFQFSSPSAKCLLGIFRDVTQSLLDELFKLKDEFLSPTGSLRRQGLESQARILGQNVGELYALLRLIEASRVERSQVGTAIPLELLVRDCVGEQDKAISIVRPQWKYNYKYLNAVEELKGLTPAEEIFKRSPPYFAVFSYPGLERGNTLSLVLLAHEIGHLMDDIHDISGTSTNVGSRIVLERCRFDEKSVQKLVSLRAKIELPQVMDVLKVLPISTHENNTLVDMCIKWVREFTADILAIRLLGPSYFFALAEVCASVVDIDDQVENYPPPRLRLQLILREMEDSRGGLGYRDRLARMAEGSGGYRDLQAKVDEYISVWKRTIDTPAKTEGKTPEEELESSRGEIVKAAIWNYLEEVTTKVRNILTGEKAYKLPQDIFTLVRFLESKIPPTQRRVQHEAWLSPIGIKDILNAGWICKLTGPEKRKLPERQETISVSPSTSFASLSALSELVTFAIEFSAMYRDFLGRRRRKASPAGALTQTSPPLTPIANGEGKAPAFGGVLSSIELMSRIVHGARNPERALVVSPLFDLGQIKPSSVDVRLGNKFILTRQSRMLGLDPGVPVGETKMRIREYQELTFVQFGRPFVLHPHQFVLGTTLEYFSFPDDLMAYVIGRSSWGRLGLVIATATQVGPGFKGTLTLELANVGTVPIALYPAARIAQLVVHRMENPAPLDQTGKYQFSTRPQFSHVYDDWEFQQKILIDDPEEMGG
jgi:dCTP deaminase